MLRSWLSSWTQNRKRPLLHTPSLPPKLASLLVGVSLTSSVLANAILANFVLVVNSVHAAQLTQWNFDPTTHWLTLKVPGGTSPQYFLLAQPPRIVVDLPNTQVDSVPIAATYSGMVQSVRVGQFQPELTRIVIEFDPNITFAPGHITIQPGGPTRSSEHGNRDVAVADTWYIRPLLVGQTDSSPLPPAPVTPPTLSPNLASAPSAISDDLPLEPAETTSDAIGSNASSQPPLPDNFASRNLPPLEPGALEIPVTVPGEALPPSESSLSLDEPATQDGTIPPLAAAQTGRVIQDNMTVEELAEEELVEEELAEEELVEEELAEEELAEEELVEEKLVEEELVEDEAPEDDLIKEPSFADLPAPETAFLVPPAPESLPELPSNASDAQSSQDAEVPVITFGQPLSQAPNAQGEDSPVSESTQTTLSLRYPRETSLPVNPDQPRQEVLVVTQAVRDRAGNIAIPEGSLVIGRFEQIGQQLQFVAQALTVGDRTIRLDSAVVELSGDAIEPHQQIQLPLDPSVLGVTR